MIIKVNNRMKSVINNCRSLFVITGINERYICIEETDEKDKCFYVLPLKNKKMYYQWYMYGSEIAMIEIKLKHKWCYYDVTDNKRLVKKIVDIYYQSLSNDNETKQLFT